MKKQKGFSLIELLIVVVIIGIIAAIAIPNLLASRRAANEASAISSLRTYHSAQLTYQTTTGSGNYAGDMSNGINAFTVLAGVGLLDDVLGSGIKSGYQFIGSAIPASNGAPSTFAGVAIPISLGLGVGGGPISLGFFRYSLAEIVQTGTRYFAVVTDGVINHESVSSLGYGMDVDDTSGSYEIINGTPLDSPIPIYPINTKEVVLY